jgi:4-amino-4-deoxy-L-arabinose transferase-like glycosyltransferase
MVIVLSWYVPAVLKGGREYFEATLLHHSAARFAKGTSHIRPFYYFFYNFPLHFLPWTFFLPAAIACGFSQGALKKRKEFLYLLAWSVVIFLFFSFSRGKRTLYLLPLFPAVSLMVGKLWDDFIASPMEHFEQKWISIPLYGLMGVTLAAAGGTLWIASSRFPSHAVYVYPVAFLLVGMGVALYVLGRLRRYAIILLVLVGVMGAGFFYTFKVGFPLINPLKSARFVSEEILSRIQPGERVAVYGVPDTGPYNYYTGIMPILELERLEAVRAFLESENRVYCLLWNKDLAHYQAIPGWPAAEVISRQRVGHRDIVLVSNRKDRR